MRRSHAPPTEITGTVSDPSDYFGGKSPFPLAPDRDGSSKEGLPAALNPMYQTSVPLVHGDPNMGGYKLSAGHGYRRPPPDGALPGLGADKSNYHDPASKQMQHDPLAGTDQQGRGGAAATTNGGNIPYAAAAAQFPYGGTSGGKNADLISTGASRSPFGVDPNSFANFKRVSSYLRHVGKTGKTGKTGVKTGVKTGKPDRGEDSLDPKRIAESIYALALNVKSLKDSVVAPSTMGTSSKNEKTKTEKTEKTEKKGAVAAGAMGEEKDDGERGMSSVSVSPLIRSLASRIQALEAKRHHGGGGKATAGVLESDAVADEGKEGGGEATG